MVQWWYVISFLIPIHCFSFFVCVHFIILFDISITVIIFRSFILNIVATLHVILISTWICVLNILFDLRRVIYKWAEPKKFTSNSRRQIVYRPTHSFYDSINSALYLFYLLYVDIKMQTYKNADFKKCRLIELHTLKSADL